MCKYCDETLYRYERKRFVTEEEMYESIDKKFCTECGAPLGEVKPLTVEQLRKMDGKPVFLETGEVSIREQLIAKWEILVSHDDTVFFFTQRLKGFSEKNYGTTWFAYTQEPKGEAE